MSDKLREAFEAMMRKDYSLFPLDKRELSHGSREWLYTSAGTQHMWNGYCAALAEGSAPITDEQILELASVYWDRSGNVLYARAENESAQIQNEVNAFARDLLSRPIAEGEKADSFHLAGGKPETDTRVYVAITRPEGYEDVHPQLVMEDALRVQSYGWPQDFEFEVIPSPPAAQGKE